MSRHEVKSEDESRLWVFGWDQPLQSFFLQVHHLDAPEDHEDRCQYVVGASADTHCYEVEDLVRVAKSRDLYIPLETQTDLYLEKDEGR